MNHWERYLEFGRQLVITGDLDPVYIVLYRAGLPYEPLCEWLLAYWCFYESGLCCDVVESGHFWDAMRQACSPSAPRGRERRHFRGDRAVHAIQRLERRFGTASNVVEYLGEGGALAVIGRAKSLPMFGNWAGFKAADMLERVLGRRIDFSLCELAIYREPREGAALVWRGDPHAPVNVGEVVAATVAHLDLPAPPRYDRRVGLQEVETMLCKYKSMVGGHYYLGKDIDELRKSLSHHGSLAQSWLKFVP